MRLPLEQQLRPVQKIVLKVCVLFNGLDRLADALDFTLPTEEEAQKIGRSTYRLDYGIAKLPG